MEGSNSFQIKTTHFEGPLELLLDLIEKRKLHISDISLAQVTDDYIAHIEKKEQFPMKEAAQFVLIASTLLLIKSKALLPGIALSLEEEADIKDLEERLRLYKKMRDLSVHIRSRFGTHCIYGREDSSIDRVVFTPHKGITKESLFQSALDAIARFPKPEKLSRAIVEKVMTLEEMIDTLLIKVNQNLKMRFSDLNKEQKGDNRENKLNLIVGFLAMLELVKRGVLAVEQSNLFGEMELEHQGEPGVPNYS